MPIARHRRETSALRRRLAALLALGALPALCGCTTGIEECRTTYPPGSAAYESCYRAEMARENRELNRRAIEELKTSL